jgi:hypothetical protein
VRAFFLLATLTSLILPFPALGPTQGFAVEPPAVAPAPTPENQRLVEAITATSLRLKLLEETIAAQAASSQSPIWAVEGFAEIDRRVERLARYQERALAGLENPAPRLSEPMVLFSVGLCMLVLGFIGGRILGNRRDRRGLL